MHFVERYLSILSTSQIDACTTIARTFGPGSPILLGPSGPGGPAGPGGPWYKKNIACQ